MERAVYRIIDANFNRAREAIRVMEDYCRFLLNSAILSSRAKELRHQLSMRINQLDANKLLVCRDTLNDIGTIETEKNRINRADLKECFTAAGKRLSEALRVLAETASTVNQATAQAIEQLRYACYTLEKDIVLFSEPLERFKRVRLYIIISSNLPSEVLFLTAKCVKGQADCIQLRAKAVEDDKHLAIAEEFVKLCREEGVLSIINDRIDIAVASGADGVHLGQSDLSVEHARRLQLSPLIIGKSTHSIEQLIVQRDKCPTYVSLGPIYTTPTKPAVKSVGLEYIGQSKQILADTGICSVAIGGINLTNIEEVLVAGIQTVAVCSAVTKASDPAAVCRALKEKIRGLRG
jgi:thiamine-phosphate pyrophosphorylase